MNIHGEQTWNLSQVDIRLIGARPKNTPDIFASVQSSKRYTPLTSVPLFIAVLNNCDIYVGFFKCKMDFLKICQLTCSKACSYFLGCGCPDFAVDSKSVIPLRIIYTKYSSDVPNRSVSSFRKNIHKHPNFNPEVTPS